MFGCWGSEPERLQVKLEDIVKELIDVEAIDQPPMIGHA